MSDTNKNKRTKLSDLFRYHRNELSGEERNAFERELQKDPFIEDAYDGFGSISQEDALKDIRSLQKRLKTRTVRLQRVKIYRIAASIVVLMIISTLFIILDKNKPGRQLAENSVQPETLDITRNEPVAEKILKDRSYENPELASEKKPGRPDKKKQGAVAENRVESVESIKIAEAIKDNSISEIKTKRADVYLSRSAAPSNALAKDSEVVVVGYGTKKSGDEIKNEEYMPPQPSKGKPDFDKYIRENIHRPDTATSGQRAVVVLTFLVRTDGSIDSIRVVRSPGRLFSDEAIRLISSGPSWKPAEDNGRKINDIVRLRVVFR